MNVAWSNDQSLDKEIKAEELAEQKLLFPKLRAWYYGSSEHIDVIRKHYGAFPSRPEDLAYWPHWRDARKRYLALTDGVSLPPPIPHADEPEKLKAQGNAALKAKDFPEAIALYTQAIAADSKNHVYYSNRSAAHLHNGDAEAALVDGDACIRMKSDWPKGYNRKGTALHRLGRLREAVGVYEKGIKFCSSVPDETLASALEAVNEALASAEQQASSSASGLPFSASSSSRSNMDVSGNIGGEELADWKQQAEEYKDRGNAAFKDKDHDSAIRYYSMAVDIDPDNHVLYSNRSAAYLSLGDAKSKALADANKCIALRPDWVKGYSRKGAAEHALGRFDAAIETLSSAARMAPDDEAIARNLRTAKEAAERDRAVKAERARREYEAYQTAEAARKAAVAANSESLVSNFFSDIVDEEERIAEERREREAHARRNRVQTEKTEKYTSQDLGNAETQIARLLAPNFKFKNLNPFRVMQLDIDATVEDIKYRYKKLSVIIHPDKNRGLDGAQEAFDELKRAHEDLLDESKRELVISTIDSTRASTKRERRKLVSKGLKELDLEPIDIKIDKDVMKAFAGKL